jgi:succinate-acetate transporter protein
MFFHFNVHCTLQKMRTLLVIILFLSAQFAFAVPAGSERNSLTWLAGHGGELEGRSTSYNQNGVCDIYNPFGHVTYQDTALLLQWK